MNLFKTRTSVMRDFEKSHRQACILASFPKSGNTWVRFIIANGYNLVSPDLREIDFYNIHDIVPELPEGEIRFFKNFPSVYKTHKKFAGKKHPVILVIRDPFDSLFSYYKYLNGAKSRSIDLEALVKHEKFGIRALVEHNNYFLNRCSSLLIISYEKLLHQPFTEAKKIFDFLNFRISSENIEAAVELSSFKAMRGVEIRKGRKFKKNEFLFTRKGIAGEGRKEISRSADLMTYVESELKKSPMLYFLYS